MVPCCPWCSVGPVLCHCFFSPSVYFTAQSGVSHDVPAGKMISGSPAFDNRIWLRATAIFQRLPELLKRLERLEKQAARSAEPGEEGNSE